MIMAPKAGGDPLKCTLKIALENLIQRLLEISTHLPVCPKNLSAPAAPASIELNSAY